MRTYLDHAATTPVRPEVSSQVADDLAEGLGGWANPAALHSSGRRAGALLAQARARLADALAVDPHEVLFPSGGTEADALVVTGRVLAARAAHPNAAPHLVVSPIEHPAVLQTARAAATHLGAHLSELEVDAAGRVAIQSLTRAVTPGSGAGGRHRGEWTPPALVSVMAANNETGLVQDMAALVGAVREATGAPSPRNAGYVPVHSDAVAALGKTTIDLHGWGLDAMSITGHKIGAPVGVGALVARRDLDLVAVSGGGRQERGLRSGTQDVVAARALALAVELAVTERREEAARLEALRTRLLEGACALPGVHATLPADAAHLGAIAHLWFEQADAEALLMSLDLAGVDASAGSACHAGVAGPSHVLEAMGLGSDAARATLRCSLGATTRPEDIERLLVVLPGALAAARNAAAALR